MAQVKEASTGGLIGDESDDELSSSAAAAAQMDYAPESFWLSKDAEMDWLDRNAFMERKDSGKASNTNNSNSNMNLGSSNRYTKTKPSIIGLPKPTKTSYAEAKSRRNCKATTIRMFPKRSGSVGSNKSEPSSPKVSCMGRVRSKKERSRRSSKNRNKPISSNTSTDNNIKPGFWKNFRFMFRTKSPTVVQEEASKMSASASASASASSSAAAAAPAPGLGGIKRFASGRRSDAWPPP